MNTISNMFRELSMSYIVGYNKLSDSLKDLFDATYKRHLSSISEKRRYYFTEKFIEKVQGKEYYVEVYFKHGDFYIYLPNYRWVKVNSD